MTSVLPESSKPIAIDQIFGEIKKCMEDDKGFYITQLDGTKILITTQNGALKTQSTAQEILFAPTPDENYKIYEGLRVYYVGFDENKGVFMCHKGHISSLRDENGEELFTIDGTTVSEYQAASPVFSYDKTEKSLHLIGVILKTQKVAAKGEQAIRFSQRLPIDQEERKINDIQPNLGIPRGTIKVKYGEFKGLELSKGGRGPRSIKINGPDVKNIIYRLSFNDGKNPHYHTDYNNDDQETLYQKALEEFVKLFDKDKSIPKSFTFECYKETFTATQ